MQYRPEIDGLRAIAVLPVILFHAHVPGFGGGFIGVDVFFVISGYLITSILLFELKEGRFSLWRFYERRARRILPALFVVIAFTSFFAYRWMLPHDLWDYGLSVVATAFFASNFYFWTATGYFATASELKPLLHTWSLAIEEQFYIVFPVLLWGLWRLGGRRVGLPIAALTLLALASLAWAEWGLSANRAAQFFLPLARAWELLVGALCAFAVQRGVSGGQGWLAALSAALLLAGFALIDAGTAWPSLMTLLPVLGTAGLILWARPGAGIGRLLAWRPLVAIGLISYSAYLWHHPIYALARLRLIEVTPVWTAALFVLTFGLAWATWIWIETPFRRRGAGAPFSTSFVSISAPLVLILTVVLGLGLAVSGKDFERRTPLGATYAELNLQHRLLPNEGIGRDCDFETGELPDECRIGNNPEMIFWGDSYVKHLLTDLSAHELGSGVVQITLNGCPPILEISPFARRAHERDTRDCLEHNIAAMDWIGGNAKKSEIVVLSSRFVMLVRKLVLQDGVVPPDLVEHVTEAKFKETIDQLKKLGLRPIVVSPLPKTEGNLGHCAAKVLQFGYASEICDFTEHQFAEETIAQFRLLDELAMHVPVIRLDHWLCAGGVCDIIQNGKIVFRDEDHFSRDATWLRQNDLKLFDKIREAADAFYGERAGK